MRKFKAKKRKKINSFLIIFIIIGILIIKYDKNVLMPFLILDNRDMFNQKINDTEFLLKYALNLDLVKEKKEDVSVVKKEPVIDKTKETIDNPPLIPLVYIYNTHQKEEYKSSYLNDYNINSTVLLASKILKEYLNNYGITAIVEESDLVAMRNDLGLKYGYSYKVSRTALETAYQKNPTLTYFIDLHRDSGSHEKTTLVSGNESFAKMLFVVGLDHQAFEGNLNLATNLCDRINALNNSLCRGALKKSGAGVNGIYNQDFNNNVMLVEVGGENNTIDEVNNSLKILASVLANYIKGE